LPDITLAKPIFKDGKLVAFSATHGGIAARQSAARIREFPNRARVFEEGLQIPPN